jgi:putative ABC transport system ATP-binding protein
MTHVLLETRDLTKEFGSAGTLIRAVDCVSLQVHAGEMVLIMGPSGSGKTTLLTMAGGLLRPTSGTVTVAGLEITSLSEPELAGVRRHLVGFVFQSFNLWEGLTAQENVELALNIGGISGGAAHERARRLLEERGLSHRARFRSRDLSGGEKQRLSIARALANEPCLLLADEPTANLDSRHGRDVMRLLADIAHWPDRAVIVVGHDQRIREVADRVLWLEDGRLSDMSLLVRDPVCGMSFEQAQAVSSQYEGATYFFCSAGCRREFEEDPSRFVLVPSR